MKTFKIILLLSLLTRLGFAQSGKATIPLDNPATLKMVHVDAVQTTHDVKKALKVTDNKSTDTEAKFVKLSDVDFSNGTIEIELAGQPAAGAAQDARGFVGVAFRVAADNSTFECIYLRPTNGRANDQVRRNHSVQYFSFPEFPWHRLRQEFPKKYETYVDLVPGEWTKVKIVVDGETAKLYVHGASQPTLIVNDLKHGAASHGQLGLWIGPGTEAYFTNLTVTTN